MVPSEPAICPGGESGVIAGPPLRVLVIRLGYVGLLKTAIELEGYRNTLARVSLELTLFCGSGCHQK